MRRPPIVQVVGFKNSGKTTVVSGLVRRFGAQGLRVATAKHHGHADDLDVPATDTALHRAAGACATAIASAGLSAVWEPRELSLSELADRLPPCDLVIAEGFKGANFPKWVLLRDEADYPLLAQVTQAIGISAWFDCVHPTLPVLPLDDYDGIAKAIWRTIQLEDQLERGW
ncbi:molybdopterin-guanine dinucleotide biosynthesis protein B [Cohnella nanjingensis]|nr:molybdopterin-guanine dinucleotide biosynthesis protein B [Cohnella nanjingensis]